MKTKITFIIITLFLTTLSFSQNNKIDSLNRELQNQHSEKEIIGIYLRLSIFYYYVNSDSAIISADKAIELSQKINYDEGEISALIQKGNGYLAKGNYKTAIKIYETALQIANKIDSPKWQANCIASIAGVYYFQDNYTKALEYFLQGLKIDEKLDNKEGIASTNNTIGQIYFNLHDNENAKKYFLKALSYYENGQNYAALSAVLGNLGAVSKKKEALKYYTEALIVAKKSNNSRREAESLGNIAISYKDMKQYKKAFEYHNKAQIILEKLGDEKIIITNLVNTAIVCIEIKEFQKGIELCKKSLEIANNIGGFKHKKHIYEVLTELYINQNNKIQALIFYQKYINTTDSLFNKEKYEQIAELNTKYETEKKEQQIEIQQKENQLQQAEIQTKQRTIWSIIIGTFLLLASVIIFYLQRQKAIKQKHEKQMLKMQVETQDNIKQELASALHSGAGSELTSIILSLENKNTEKKLSQDIERIRNHYKIIRNKSHILAIPSFIQTTIEDEINDIATTFKTETQNINCSIFSKKTWKDIHPIIQQNIYRIVQELLTNTAKHANAAEIDLQLTRHDKHISLIYEDNGKGYNPQEIKQNLGYKNEITTRVKAVNGSFTDDSRQGQGVNLSFNFPVKYEK